MPSSNWRSPSPSPLVAPPIGPDAELQPDARLLPVPARQAIRPVLRHRRQSAAVRTPCGHLQAVAHVESQGEDRPTDRPHTTKLWRAMHRGNIHDHVSQGTIGFEAQIDKCLELSEYLYNKIKDREGYQMVFDGKVCTSFFDRLISMLALKSSCRVLKMFTFHHVCPLLLGRIHP